MPSTVFLFFIIKSPQKISLNYILYQQEQRNTKEIAEAKE